MEKPSGWFTYNLPSEMELLCPISQSEVLCLPPSTASLPDPRPGPQEWGGHAATVGLPDELRPGPPREAFPWVLRP